MSRLAGVHLLVGGVVGGVRGGVSGRVSGGALGLLLCGLMPAWDAWAGMAQTASQPGATEAKPAAGDMPGEQQRADKGDREDRWYVVELMGARTGFMHMTITRGDTITTQSRMQFKMGRGDKGVSIRMESSVEETLDAKPVRMTSKSLMGQMAQEQVWTFQDGTIAITTTQAGNTSTRTIDAPKEAWMTPAAAERYGREQVALGAKEIAIRMMDPTMGPFLVRSTRSGFEPVKLTLDGRDVDAIKTQVKLDAGAQQIDSIEYLDKAGDLLKSLTAMSGLEIVTTRTTRAKAMEALGAGEVPEIMVNTFVEPSKRIERARETTRGVYVLSVQKGKLPALPDSGFQQVTMLADGRARVDVRTTNPAPAPEEDKTNPRYLGASVMMDVHDPKLREFVSKVLDKHPGASPSQQARALRVAVYGLIDSKSLGVALGTASEVVRTREGDCSEHGVLLAAALRIAGIPSRVATGLIYADSFMGGKDIFGYHMWTQALLTDEAGTPAWIDLDATLPERTEFDATHIALSTTSLDDEEGMNPLLPIAGLMGNLAIEVESVEHQGEPKKGGK